MALTAWAGSGGDEFVVVMPETALAQEGQAAARMRFAVEADGFLRDRGRNHCVRRALRNGSEAIRCFTCWRRPTGRFRPKR